MNITVSTKIDNIAKETKEAVIEKATKFVKFCKIRKTEIVMDKEAELYVVEFVVSSERGGTIIAKSKADEWPIAIEHASEKIEKQLRRLKGKVKSHRMKKYKDTDASSDEAAQKEEETYEEVVDKMKNS